MKTKFFGGIALVAVATAMAFNVSLNLNNNSETYTLSLVDVEEAKAFDIVEWWNRLDWNCVSTDCGFIYADCPEFAGKGKGTVPHSWNCPCCP